jgi:hypothetical protein
MHKEIIKRLKKDGWSVTLHDVGHDRPDMVIAVKLTDAIDLWYLSKQCHDLPMGAIFLTGNNIAYFPVLNADADDYKEIMS